MASSPPKKNTAFSFEVSLPSQDGSVFQDDPTLAAGDVQVSIDGGSFSNIASLPTAIGSSATLTVALTSGEMNGDRIVVRFRDAAGDEWCDVTCEIFTVTQQIDDLASQASVDDLPTNAELATALAAADDAVLSALATVAGYVDTEVAAIKAKTDLIPGTQDGKTFAEMMLLMSAVLLGKASGLDTTTAIYRAIDDSKDRVTATVDANGNRSAVTLDAA